MNLEQLLEDVTARNEDEVNTLFTKCTEDSRRVAEYREILDKSTQAHRDAMKRVLDEKLKLVQNYVDKYIKTIPEPAEYNLNRVNELRYAIANGSDATLEDRCAKMAALRELQMFLAKFPFIDRVAEIIRQATGCTDVVVKGDSPCDRKLYINGSAWMDSTTSAREYYDRDSEQPRKSSTANIRLFGDKSVAIVNFWEIYIILMPINLHYILGAEECERWGHGAGPVREHPKILRRLCTNTGRVEQRTELLEDLSDRAFVPVVLWNAMDRLTVNQCLQGAEAVNIKCGNTIKHWFACRLQKIFKDPLREAAYLFQFDSEQRAFKWEYRRNTDNHIKFDPDTCELLQPEVGWTVVPVGDVVIRDLHDFVAKQTPWIECYGKVTVRVLCKKDIDPVAEWRKRGNGLLSSYAESCFSIVNIAKTDNPEIYLMDVLLRVPQAEAFRNGTKCGDGGYNLRCEKPMWSESPVIF